MAPNEEEIEYKTDWGTSVAKERLKKDIIDQRIDKWKPKEVYFDPKRYDQFYKYYKYENFRTNLLTLRKAVTKAHEHAARDQVAFNAFARRDSPAVSDSIQEPRWHQSEAQKALRHLVQTEKIDGMKPADVRKLNPSFMQYSKKQFRDHLQHEKTRHWKKMHNKEYAERVQYLKSMVVINNPK